MENNFDYEIDVEDAIMRTKGRKNRQSKEFKKFAKSGIVRKYVVPDENGAIVVSRVFKLFGAAEA